MGQLALLHLTATPPAENERDGGLQGREEERGGITPIVNDLIPEMKGEASAHITLASPGHMAPIYKLGAGLQGAEACWRASPLPQVLLKSSWLDECICVCKRVYNENLLKSNLEKVQSFQDKDLKAVRLSLSSNSCSCFGEQIRK